MPAIFSTIEAERVDTVIFICSSKTSCASVSKDLTALRPMQKSPYLSVGKIMQVLLPFMRHVISTETVGRTHVVTFTLQDADVHDQRIALHIEKLLQYLMQIEVLDENSVQQFRDAAGLQTTIH